MLGRHTLRHSRDALLGRHSTGSQAGSCGPHELLRQGVDIDTLAGKVTRCGAGELSRLMMSERDDHWCTRRVLWMHGTALYAFHPTHHARRAGKRGLANFYEE